MSRNDSSTFQFSEAYAWQESKTRDSKIFKENLSHSFDAKEFSTHAWISRLNNHPVIATETSDESKNEL